VSEIDRVALVDAHPATLAAAKEALDVPEERFFPSLEAALEAEDAEAVLVTVPLVAHVQVAQATLAAGKHVLVEKPFAPSVAEAREVVETAAERGLTLMVSQNYRFFPAPRVVADLIQRGELGPVGTVHVDFRKHITAKTGSARHFALENPLLADMAIHHFDLMRMVLGQEARSLVCHTWNPPGSPFSDDPAGIAAVDFEGGAVATWRGSWVSPGPGTNWGGEWRVECEKGEIVWTSRGDGGDVTDDRVTVIPVGGKPRELTMPTLRRHGRAGALAAFAEAIAAGKEPETSGRDNLGSLALVEAAVASAATGATVPINR
jgi:predicted dehydrogenase